LLTDERFAEFEEALHSLPENNHPSKKTVNCCLHFLYWCIAIIFMIALGYLFLIILQLALFNLIMLVVMIVWWVRIFKVARAMIDRCIVGAKTKEYRSFIKKLKDSDSIKDTHIEI
jgi:ABC-type bacteriocin/lantibiotic exporter with double-glycine peptidase domain